MELFESAINLALNACSASGRVFIGYSGGLDSELLLTLTARLIKGTDISVQAIHVNHQLNPASSDWQKSCAERCAELEVEFNSETVAIDTAKGDIENQARQARYACFTKKLQPGDVLLLAHHQNDQAETVLLNLFRGSGPRGLSAMPHRRALGDGQLYRPLLSFSRQAIYQAALALNLRWITDPSNDSLYYRRNVIRHQLLEPMKDYWPSLVTTIARSAEQCAKQVELIETLLQTNLTEATTANGSLSVSYVLSQPPLLQAELIRLWLRKNHLPALSDKRLQSVLGELLPAGASAVPSLYYADYVLYRHGDNLCFKRQDWFVSPEKEFLWRGDEPLYLTEQRHLKPLPVERAGLIIGDAELSVRFRAGGERIRLVNKKHHQSLKKLMQQWQIPAILRDQIPLIYINQQLACVVGYAISAEFFSFDAPGVQIFEDQFADSRGSVRDSLGRG